MSPNPSIPFVRKQTNPQLKDLLDLLKKDIFLSLNCHAIATVTAFDPTDQTVQATVNYTKSVQQSGPNGTYQVVSVPYPILLDMPAIILGGGLAHLTFPISPGDTCLVLFNDRDLDNWFQSGQVGPVASARLHSFSDGIALVGLNSSEGALEGYDMTRALLYNGTTKVGVGAEKVLISNALYTLNGLLQNLVTGIEQLVTATAAITVTAVTSGGGVSGPPANAAAIIAAGTAITATAAQIGALLE